MLPMPGVKNHLTPALSPEGGEGVQPVSPVNENIWTRREASSSG